MTDGGEIVKAFIGGKSVGLRVVPHGGRFRAYCSGTGLSSVLDITLNIDLPITLLLSAWEYMGIPAVLQTYLDGLKRGRLSYLQWIQCYMPKLALLALTQVTQVT